MRGAAEIMLNTQFDSDERPEQPDGAREAVHRDTTLYVGCTDIEEAYAELTARGLQAAPPRTAPYGLRFFSAQDPDGYGVVLQELRPAS